MAKRFNLSALLVIACMALSLGVGPGCSGNASQETPSETQSEQQAQETAEGTATIKLAIEGWESTNRGVSVVVEGTAADGQSIRSYETVLPRQDKELSLEEGSYAFSVDGSKISDDTIIYSSASVKADVKAGQNAVVTINVAKDAEATQELARKAEEEAAAKAQAEAEEAARAQAEAEATAQAQAEAEAAAQAEVQRKAEAEAAAAAQAQEQTVYITNSGSKYHRDGCRYLKKSKIPISLSDAQAQGYTACSVCF